jgi:hypothetical protein
MECSLEADGSRFSVGATPDPLGPRDDASPCLDKFGSDVSVSREKKSSTCSGLRISEDIGGISQRIAQYCQSAVCTAWERGLGKVTVALRQYSPRARPLAESVWLALVGIGAVRPLPVLSPLVVVVLSHHSAM